MFKVKQIDDISIDSYGGLQFFHNFIEKTNFEKIIEQELGSRPAQAQYSYKNVIITFIANCLAGGSYTEDINILRSKQASLAGASYCSSDTFTRVIRQFIDLDHMELKESGKGTETEFFFNKPLNQILLQSYDKYFRKEGYNILDHDHTKLFTNKPDAKSCYKGRGVLCFGLLYGSNSFVSIYAKRKCHSEIRSDRSIASGIRSYERDRTFFRHIQG